MAIVKPSEVFKAGHGTVESPVEAEGIDMEQVYTMVDNRTFSRLSMCATFGKEGAEFYEKVMSREKPFPRRAVENIEEEN